MCDKEIDWDDVRQEQAIARWEARCASPEFLDWLDHWALMDEMEQTDLEDDQE